MVGSCQMTRCRKNRLVPVRKSSFFTDTGGSAKGAENRHGNLMGEEQGSLI